MGLIEKETFVCFDCESTGLDPFKDRIIEIAVVKFTFSGEISSYETLIDPGMPIPPESIKIHNIEDEMVQGQPKIQDVLPHILSLVENHIVVGHSIPFDIDLLKAAAERHNVPTTLGKKPFIDTLRLARLYGQSPVNSLEKLREHFNIPAEGAHRAMSDVRVNIAVFKHLAKAFKTTEAMLKRLEKPVALRLMPLGKHKGRPFRELPREYLAWAANQNFDDDLLFSIRSELKKRRVNPRFNQSGNPFSSL